MSISVYNLVSYLKNKLESDQNLRNVIVLGEISNFHRQLNSGHCYFTLKDDRAQIDCVMFKSQANKLEFDPKNGDSVLINANTSIFEASGRLQLYVNAMKLDGLGLLYKQYEELKIKLANQGYFKDEHKKKKAFIYPNNIAVLVGDKSAALSDIKTCIARRWPLTNVDYYSVLVQGNDASKDIIEKLLVADKLNYDAIILARGGGSFEDLFCFNDEELVKTIYNLNTFIVTGVGHEQDFTLVDFVSDLRAPTPTAAVELITPDIRKVNEDLNNLIEDLNYAIYLKINDNKKILNNLINSNVFKNPKSIINNQYLKIDYLNERLFSFNKKIILIKSIINEDNIKLKNNISNKIKLKMLYNDNLKDKLNKSILSNLNNNKLNIKRLSSLIKAYSLDNLLNKGYSVLYKNGNIIKSINDIKENDLLNIRLYDGSLSAIVKEKYGK